MTRKLNSDRRGAAKGRATSAVVFVHGYGADGADLLGLSDPLAPHLPGTAFYAPNAPEPSAANPMGFQWFAIPRIDGSAPEAAEAGLKQSADDLNAFLDGVLQDEGLAPEKLVLFGFSQGTMLSLEVAPRRFEPLGAVVGFSGRLMAPERLADEAVSHPPILLVHGDSDDVVPPASLPAAEEALRAAGFDVITHVSKGVGHGIAPDGLSLALAFIRDHLGIAG